MRHSPECQNIISIIFTLTIYIDDSVTIRTDIFSISITVLKSIKADLDRFQLRYFVCFFRSA